MSELPASSLEQRMQQLRRWGSHTLAYSAAVQPGLEHFQDERGFIAFKTHRNRTLVLSDPVCEPGRQAEILDDFLDRYPEVSFWQISRNTAQVLEQRSFYINEMGPDTRISLQDYRFSGKSKRNLRAAGNRANRLGYRIQEVSLDDVDVAGLRALSDAWHQTRTLSRHEVIFLNRPLTWKREMDVRRWIALDSESQPVAFVFCDPIYRDQKVTGYSTSFKRRQPGADLRVEQAITRVIIETLQSEGLEWLSLGLSPLADLADEEFRYNWLVKWFYNRIYRSWLFNRYVFPLQGHMQFKRDFRGQETQTYYASRRFLNTPHYLAFARVANLFGTDTALEAAEKQSAVGT